jgi:hypothetical protein
MIKRHTAVYRYSVPFAFKIQELRDILHEAGAKVVALQRRIVEYAISEKMLRAMEMKALEAKG